MTQPVGREIANKLQTGENPLDFVKRNLAAIQQKPKIDPVVSIQTEEAKRAEEETKRKQEETQKQELETKQLQDETKQVKGETHVNQILEEPTETETEVEEEPGSAAANFKKVRKVLGETKNQLVTTQDELNKAKKELDKYKTGEVYPDVLAEKEAEIARLTKYEKMLALKTSKEYQEKYVNPLTEINNKLGEIAKDYNIPFEVMGKALKANNRADLNRFLSQHFDDVGALEVKQLINQAQDLQKQAVEAEKEPQTALEQLIQQGERVRVQKQEQTRRELQQNVRSIWTDVLLELEKDGKAQELIYRENDPEHNKHIVDPIVKHAAGEFGKLIKDLVDGGLEKLSPAAGKALAKSFLLGSASAVAMETRAAAAKHADDIESNASRLRKIYRPPVGSMTPGVETTSQERKPMSPQEAGRSLINSVLANKRT